VRGCARGTAKVIPGQRAAGLGTADTDPGEGYDVKVQIEPGKRVRMRVHLGAVGGQTIEDSVVEYIQGSGKMLPGLEAALAGLKSGAKKQGVLRAAQAFGDPVHSPHKTVKRTEFPGEAQLAAGARFAAKGVNGADVVLLIHAIKGDDVDVQLLHPLADKDVEYSVEVLSVTDPHPPPFPADALKIDEG
jgi:FKBP-type peptidyl-prolyl cis-trans isomerase 2